MLEGRLFLNMGRFKPCTESMVFIPAHFREKIGYPSTGPDYGPPNPAALLPDDTIADALQKLDIELSKISNAAAPLPDHNAQNQYLVDVRNYILELDVAQTYSACLAGVRTNYQQSVHYKSA